RLLVDAQHPAAAPVLCVGGRPLVDRRFLAAGDNGALPRQLALGPDALGGGGRLVLEAAVLVAARPALVARRRRGAPAALDAGLFLLRHRTRPRGTDRDILLASPR